MYNSVNFFVGDRMDKKFNEKKLKVTLAGKYRGPYFEKIKMLKTELLEKGIDVLYPPEGDMSLDNYGFFDSDRRTGDSNKDFDRAEMNFLYKTYKKCDAIIFCNFDGYLGRMTSNELYFFSSLIVCNFEKGQEEYYNLVNGYIPIYLLEEVNVDSFNNSDELGDFLILLKYGMDNGLIKVGLNSFYDDLEKGKIIKIKIKK